MPSNDLLLLDSIVEKNKASYGTRTEDSEYFELFAIDSVLKNYDLSLEQLEDGWVDGGDDGSIDGFYVFIDGLYLSDDIDLKYVRAEPVLEIFMLSMKVAEGFKQAPLTALVSSAPDLLTLIHENPTNPYNEQLLDIRASFRSAYTELAEKKPSVKINVLYCARGDTSRINKNVISKATQLRSELANLYSRSSIDVRFLGASGYWFLRNDKEPTR